MDSLSKSLGKVSIGVPSQTSVFTFVPVVQKLPVERTVTDGERPGALTGKPNEISTASQEKTDGGSMSARELFKAERVFIKDTGGAGNTNRPGTQLQPSVDHVSVSQSKAAPSVRVASENTPDRPAAGTAAMETAADKHHRGVSQRQRHDTSGLSEAGSGFFANIASVSEGRTSPADSADLFPTPASSRESLVSSLTSPVSPCSSVLSGIFSPAVVPVRRHFLAPGSSLVHTPCFSSCESLSSSVCPLSPPRHRPPLTRLSLLTAILRKGRLPVLSPVLQKPYTPCWPVNPVTLSFCNACSAASSVASIPLQFSSPFSSSASIDSQSHVPGEPNRRVAAPCDELCPQTRAKRRSEQIRSSSASRVLSPAAVKSTLPRAPPLFCSNFSQNSVSHEEIDSEKLHISTSPEPKPIGADVFLQGPDTNLQKLASPWREAVSEQEASAPRKWSRAPNSALSKLHLLSQQLRSPPVRSPPVSPPRLRSPAITVFCDTPPPSVQTTTGRSCSQASARCLSPSRYTPMSFQGWPSPTSTPSPTPSPAPPIRDCSPSPCVSLRSTPSPRPRSGISECGDREGKKRKTHKIKLSYKSLAAIPTNTLLLDQQVIDEQVEREASPCERLDPHAEMCSPAELRQQSEELYAVIDEILADSIPTSKPCGSQQASRSSTPNAGLQNHSSLGRETKYASVCSLHPSTGVERKLFTTKKTKPGVIRPMTAIPRLTVEDEEEFHPKPFRQFVVRQTDSRKVGRLSLDEAGNDFYTSSKSRTWREERKPERSDASSGCDLQITEPEDQMSPRLKDASTSFTEGRMEAFETHI